MSTGNDRQARVLGLLCQGLRTTVGVKQEYPFSPLLFSLYSYDIGKNAEGVQGAVTGSEDVLVTHMLYVHIWYIP